MEQTTLKFLDAQTTTGLRVTAFAITIEDAIQDFTEWIEDNHVQIADIAYAEVYEKVGDERKLVAIFKMNEDGGMDVMAPTDGEVGSSSLKAKKKPTIIGRIKGAIL